MSQGTWLGIKPRGGGGVEGWGGGGYDKADGQRKHLTESKQQEM